VDYVGKGREHDCKDAGGRRKTAPAFSAFATSLWFSNAGAVAEERKLFRQPLPKLAGNTTLRYALGWPYSGLRLHPSRTDPVMLKDTRIKADFADKRLKFEFASPQFYTE
jgi:hypothetical protein